MTRASLLIFLLVSTAALAQERRLPPPPADLDDGSTIICLIEAQPELVGGLDLLQAQIKYPPDALADRVEGMVVVQMIVNPNGRPSDLSVIRSPDDRLNAEALRVVADSRFRWPDYAREEHRRVRFPVPVRFRLIP